MVYGLKTMDHRLSTIDHEQLSINHEIFYTKYLNGFVFLQTMSLTLYKPFTKFEFDHKKCFLSGEILGEETERQTVFSSFLIDTYKLNERPFKMLDESMCSYADLKLPVSLSTSEKFNFLENDIETAFSKGYEVVKNLEEITIFQWVAKTVYGVIYNEIAEAIKQQSSFAEGFNMSQGLIHKFSNLHLMLQSVIKPVILEDFSPWSIFLTKVNNAPEEFSYRDEINTLTFSLRIKDFGLIVCLQDNGANKNYHHDILQQVESKVLHPIQFEELCAKFFYSAYLFNRLPEYHILPTDEAVFIEAMPLRGITAKPVFDEWQFKVYGQVLENFWKRWGFLLLEIIKDPEKPMTFLSDQYGNFIADENIILPK